MIDTDEKKVDTILLAIKNQTDYSLIEKLEFIVKLEKEKEFKNFILVLLVLIEKSRWHESASTLLLRKVYKENIFCNGKDKRSYGRLFLKIVMQNAILDFVNTSTTFRRLISSILYDKTGEDTKHIIEVNSKEELLAANEFFLESYLKHTSKIDHNTMALYYNCVNDIHNETSQITISKKANSTLIKKIKDGGFSDYLYIFIRPLYISSSSNFEGVSYYVPEPFYRQIFGSHQKFINFINKLIKIGNNQKLVLQIKEFMDKYTENMKKGINYVDLKNSTYIDSKLHSFGDKND